MADPKELIEQLAKVRELCSMQISLAEQGLVLEVDWAKLKGQVEAALTKFGVIFDGEEESG